MSSDKLDISIKASLNRYLHVNGTDTNYGERCGRSDCSCFLLLGTGKPSPFDGVVPAMRAAMLALEPIELDADLDAPLPVDGRLLRDYPNELLGKGLAFVARCLDCSWEDRWCDWGVGYRAAARMRGDRHAHTCHPKKPPMTRTTADNLK